MKLTHRIVSIIMAGAFITACGAEATPTITVADVQASAVAAAFTLVAQTQAAIPTNTPPPPTETPSPTSLPTNTALALPTLAATLTNTPSNASGDHCATRVLGAPKGRETRIRIVNTVKAAVTVSLYLNETADHNECGYRSYNLSSRGDTVITDLVQGCYNLWAFNNDKKFPVNAASPYSCINNPDKWTFEIHQNFIKFIGP